MLWIVGNVGSGEARRGERYGQARLIDREVRENSPRGPVIVTSKW